MPDNKKLVAAVEDYFDDLRKIKTSGGGTAETSYYPPLTNLLNAVGGSLKPRVFCISQLAQQGADHPDFGLFAAKQVSKGQPKFGQLPEGGVVEVKPANDDAWLTADSTQVSKYWGLYRLVLVTNTRDFVLLGEDCDGNPAKLETFRLSASAADFDKALQHPHSFANKTGPALAEYLGRALSHRAALAEPRDLARLLASYARDGLARVEASGDAPSLNAVRSALEEALGVKFEGKRGVAFFRSTLVQTLFYGIFSAWVLWARQTPAPKGPFDWHDSAQLLRVPVIRELFWQLSNPGQLQPLGLNEVLDWTAAALDRVDRKAFFAKFNEGEAVPYFYEPFLEEFDPALRKQLGVWYTPAEVVRYMVARVDRALKDDLAIEDGLAAENVYVLDPCCGTGAYLAETLKRIAANLQGKGLGNLLGAQVKKAATERVFGFEIMPAPFVVAHLQVGLTMQALDAAFSDDGDERAGVFLTNALTGWDKKTGTEPKQLQMFMPELMEERDRAEQVKQDTPVLVILGNPPYNGLAGMAVGEEEELKQAYKTTKQVKKPEGQGLNDLYVRFFRMAERRIAEKTGRGVVCFISNYSWLDGLSFTGMRERFLEAFDAIRIDNLNGDKYKTGKTTPDGKSQADGAGRDDGSGIRGALRHRRAVTALGPALPRRLLLTGVGATGRLYPTCFPTSFPGVQTKKLSQNLNHKCIDRFPGRFVWFLQKHREGSRPLPGNRVGGLLPAHLGSTDELWEPISSWRKTRPKPGAASAVGRVPMEQAPFKGRASCTECGEPWWRGAKSWMAWTGNGRRQTEPWARHVLGGPDWAQPYGPWQGWYQAQSPCGWRGRPLEHCGCGSKRARCQAVGGDPGRHCGRTTTAPPRRNPNTCVWTKGMTILQPWGCRRTRL